MVLAPSFVVLDEPTSALDVSVQAQILELLQRLIDEHGLTYLFITHNLNVAQVVCDTIAVMYLGRLVEVGPADAVITDPQHPYTRMLVGAVPNMTPPERAPGRGPQVVLRTEALSKTYAAPGWFRKGGGVKAEATDDPQAPRAAVAGDAQGADLLVALQLQEVRHALSGGIGEGQHATCEYRRGRAAGRTPGLRQRPGLVVGPGRGTLASQRAQTHSTRITYGSLALSKPSMFST